ncbi:protein of unknown function [Magnetospirillum gryphiswaldense MSR-1 v2]|uniref:Uncharacterized protein n=1 Tax=Magnetospirillum gryphiswaldense (strain DSM 6361 / JCM 21280 / NBRC 15271 / MSR-1) TaxID=431944 RepID=V6F304_MAGGM|nr:protein of unknown function [Magnetospirillum gryphiswaldense MSR-1 v2]
MRTGATKARQLVLDAQFLALHIIDLAFIGKGTARFRSDGGIKRGMADFQRLDPVLKAHYNPPCIWAKVDRVRQRTKPCQQKNRALCRIAGAKTTPISIHWEKV